MLNMDYRRKIIYVVLTIICSLCCAIREKTPSVTFLSNNSSDSDKKTNETKLNADEDKSFSLQTNLTTNNKSLNFSPSSVVFSTQLQLPFPLQRIRTSNDSSQLKSIAKFNKSKNNDTKKPVAVLSLNNYDFSFWSKYKHFSRNSSKQFTTVNSVPTLMETPPIGLISSWVYSTQSSKFGNTDSFTEEGKVSFISTPQANVSHLYSPIEGKSNIMNISTTKAAFPMDGKVNTTITSADHVDLHTLEQELSHTRQKPNKDLLIAISILQHHMIPELSEDFTDILKSGTENVDDFSNEIMKVNATEGTSQNKVSTESYDNLKKEEYLAPSEELYFGEPPSESENITNIGDSFQLNVEVNTDFSAGANVFDDLDINLSMENKTGTNSLDQSKQDEEAYKMNKESNLHWFVLVMDGDCTIIRNRMNAFVTFLKAALSSKLEASYEDIYVPSVFCHKTFMVNISIDLTKYPKAETKLQSMAEANTTLIEISGEIFYLEKILKSKPINNNPMFYMKRNDDVKIVIYIAVGCMCVFILLSVVTVALIRLCRQDDVLMDLEREENKLRKDIPIRRPNVIYSPNFTKSLNLNRSNLNSYCETSEIITENEMNPSSSSRTFSSYLRYGSERGKNFTHGEGFNERKSILGSSTSKLKLLEEVQEEDEEDLDDEDDYNDDNDDDDDDDVDDDDDDDDVDDEDDDNDDDDDEDDDDDDDDDDDVDDDDEDLEDIDVSEGAYIINSVDPLSEQVVMMNENKSPTKSSPTLYRSLRSLCLSSTNEAPSTPSDLSMSFENPCYDR
ncbi:UNVERIFIED_CONTAM: hypothetical protein RMT77_007159 [Armadillidium vulgare]